ncbi:MAG: GNAT family N-acetyltransferase [Verrucomicrobia bacterium]|nr:GNAT family N-acetyltransferase [Verrucomicrobiota bacterium]
MTEFSFRPLAECAALPADHDLPKFDHDLPAAQGADASWAAVSAENGGTVVARCSLWWRNTPSLAAAERTGVIGHYAASELLAGRALLEHACAQLRAAGAGGCTAAIGPMDGSTWRRYRLITDRVGVGAMLGEAAETAASPEPPFFMEPDNPDAWPAHFTAAGFAPLAYYFSALCEDLGSAETHPLLAKAEERVRAAGVEIRTLRADHLEEELRAIYAVSAVAFESAFLYTPTTEAEFLAQYLPLAPLIRPELVFLALRGREIVGYLFCIPDQAEPQRHAPLHTAIVKTVAVLPDRAWSGLGHVLVARAHAAARRLGFTRVIHALMHERNRSLTLSRHLGALPMRRYALFVRALD